MKRTKWIAGCIVIVLLTGCTGKTVFSASESLPAEGWHKDSVLSYSFDIQEEAHYDVLLYIRHTERYPYQNMWLFLDNDTIEFYLADQRGRWLGNGAGRLKEMPVLYQQNIVLPAGTHTLNIRQGMREDVLSGVSDVGVRIDKHEAE